MHPISQTIDEVVAIFGEMGFAVAEGPDIEDDWTNFGALNIPPEHPARQEMDTFYLPGERDGRRLVLRTHTSPVQVRTMLAQPPPIRIIAPGRTYRSDYDATHSPMFHQVEGLVIDGSTHMGHLKGCLIEFLRAYFALDDLPVRFRPTCTEPSAEVDNGCARSGGERCASATARIGWRSSAGHGPPKGVRKLRHRPGSLARLRFRHGVGADRHAEVWYSRPAHLFDLTCDGCATTASRFTLIACPTAS